MASTLASPGPASHGPDRPGRGAGLASRAPGAVSSSLLRVELIYVACLTRGRSVPQSTDLLAVPAAGGSHRGLGNLLGAWPPGPVSRPGSFQNRNWFFHNSRGQKSVIKVSAGLVPSEASPWLADGRCLAVTSRGPSLCVCVPGHRSGWMRTHPHDLVLPQLPLKGPFSTSSHIPR